METKTCPKKITPQTVKETVFSILEEHSIWPVDGLAEDVAESLGLFDEEGCEHLIEEIRPIIDEIKNELNIVKTKSGKMYIVYGEGNFLQIYHEGIYAYTKITDAPMSSFKYGILISLDGKWAVARRGEDYFFLNNPKEIVETVRDYYEPWSAEYLETVWGL